MARWLRIIFLALLLLSAAGLFAADPPGQTITGQVVTSDGKPADSALVYVVGADSTRKPGVLVTTKTGVDGNFSLTAPASDPKARGQLIAQIAGVGIAKPVAIQADSPESIQLCPSTTVHLTFVDPAGAAVAGMVVRPIFFRWVGGAGSPFGPIAQLPPVVGQGWEKRTGPDGSVDFTGMPRNSIVRLEVDDDRFAALSLNDDADIPAEGALSKTIHLTAAAEISGTLTYPDSGKPAAGASIDAQSVDSGPIGGGDAVTDASGHFDIKRLTPARYVVSLDAGPTADWVAAAPTVDAQAGADNHATMYLVHGGIVTGKVRDQVDGKGLPGLMVGLHGPGDPDSAAGVQANFTGADGAFTMRVPPGSQHVYLGSEPPEGYVLPQPAPVPGQFRPVGGGFPTQMSFDVDVAEGQTVTVNFDLPRDTTPLVEGRVVDPDGKPVSGASVTYTEPGGGQRFSILGMGTTVTTDSQGHFQLHAPAGTTLRARFQSMAMEKPIKTDGGGGPYDLQLAANMNFDLLVKVVDESGTAVPDAKIRIVPQTGGASISSENRSSADGTAKYDALPVDLRWTVVAEAPGFGVTQVSAPVPPRTVPRKVEVTLTLKKTDQVIAGVVVDQQGDPVEGATVSINGGMTGAFDVKTDSKGQFSFPVVAGATGLVYMRDANGKPMLHPSVNAKAGKTDIKLVMPATPL